MALYIIGGGLSGKEGRVLARERLRVGVLKGEIEVSR